MQICLGWRGLTTSPQAIKWVHRQYLTKDELTTQNYKHRWEWGCLCTASKGGSVTCQLKSKDMETLRQSEGHSKLISSLCSLRRGKSKYPALWLQTVIFLMGNYLTQIHHHCWEKRNNTKKPVLVSTGSVFINPLRNDLRKFSTFSSLLS